MNYKIFLSYFLILSFFICLVFAYMKYNDATTETENNKLRQQIVAVLEKEITELQSQIDILKNNTNQINQGNLPQNNIIRDFIQKNPELIIGSIEQYFKQKNLDIQKNIISDNISIILKDLELGLIKTFAGKSDAKIKIVEFYDYSCKFCAQMNEINKQIISANPDVSIVFIEIPMLGPDSIEASKFSIAVSMFDQDKYLQFQDALFKYNLPKNKENLIQLAINNGIDGIKLQKYIDDNLDKIEERIKNNGIIFNNMKLQGTPTYIIGNDILIGALELNKLSDAIAKIKNDIK